MPVGSRIVSPVSGLVGSVRQTSGKGAGGKQIELHGMDGRWHRFLHLDRFTVQPGQPVAEGALLGYSGATGDVTGPHLHWDVRKQNTLWNASLSNYFDPELLVAGSAPVFGNTVSIRINGGKSQHWNVRTSPDMGNNIRTDGYVVGGQLYGGLLVEGGWALINFKGRPGYIGPKVYTKV